MDLTTFFAGAFLLLAVFGFDAVLHPRDLVLQVTRSESLGKVYVTEKMASDILQSEVDSIFVTPSILAKPEARVRGELGVGLSVAQVAGLGSVTDALQRQIGTYPDEIILHVYSENGAIRVLVTGYDSERGTDFDQEVDQVKDERIASLIRRAATTGMAQIAPYMTALSLMRRHIEDKDFTRSREVIRFAKSRLPRSGLNADRSWLENVEGLIALFSDNAGQAQDSFQHAVDSNPTNAVAVMNLALTEVAAKNGARAILLVRDLLEKHPPDDPIVLSTCYLTLGVAYLDQRQPAEADAAMKKAAQYNPNNPTVIGVWAEVKRSKGDETGAREWQERALTVERGKADYAEIAALYFAAVWNNGALDLNNPLEAVATAPDIAGKTAPTAPEAATRANSTENAAPATDKEADPNGPSGGKRID